MKINFKIITIISVIGLLAGCKGMTTAPSEQQEIAEASIDQTPQTKADVAKINAQLGMAYLEQKNVQRAKQKLLMALDQGPNIPEPWYSMGYFLETTGNPIEAQKYYIKAMQLAPSRGDAKNNYGTYLCRSGRYQESVKYFIAAANSPNYLDPASAYENAGLCSMKVAEYKQAAQFFNQALLKDPGRSLSTLKLAEVDLKLGKVKEAKTLMGQYVLSSAPTEESNQLLEKLKKKTG